MTNYTSRTQIISVLKKLGIGIVGSKVFREDLHRVLGATFKDPEWIHLNDYQIEVPDSHIETVSQEENRLGRVLLPSSFSIARFGTFLNVMGGQVSVDGIVYQYSLKRNPRNIHFAYRLFLGVENVAKNSGLTTADAAKNECKSAAKTLVETKLFDLN